MNTILVRLTVSALALLCFSMAALGQGSRPPIEQLSKLRDVSITDPQTGEVLIFNGSVWQNQAPSSDLVSDTTPQLGGDLDLNGHVITGYGDIVTHDADEFPILDGGGRIDLSALPAGTTATITDPNFDAFYIWNDTTGAPQVWHIGTGMAVSGSSPNKTVDVATNIRVGTVTATFDGGGSALSTGNTGIPWTAPYSGTITGWAISVDAGTATFKVWKAATGTAIPTISNVINTSGVAISTGTHVRSGTVTDFTSTTVTAGDQFIVALTAVATATKANLEIEITK